MVNPDVQIPKIIHFCWFSNDPFPVEVKECMDSWKKILPDYTIRHWTYDDAKNLNIKYIDDALQARKWAFASDVVRLYAIYSEGGIYMDTDILLMKRFDEFLTNRFVSFHECYHDQNYQPAEEDFNMGIQAAFLIGQKGNLFCKSLIGKYRTLEFTTDTIAPHIYAKGAIPFGYKYLNIRQDLEKEITIYPSCYMAPRRRAITADSFAVHRCEHSWYDFSLKQRIGRKVRRFFKSVLFYSKKITS